jgi:hypothetical protein
MEREQLSSGTAKRHLFLTDIFCQKRKVQGNTMDRRNVERRW